MNQKGCNFGHLTRAFNDDRCDVYVEEASGKRLLLGECKYHNDSVNENVMNKIINGLDSEWNWDFLMLFCPKLANIQNWSHRTIGCFKVNCLTGSVEWIYQAKESVITTRNRKTVFKPKKIIMVFEINDFNV